MYVTVNELSTILSQYSNDMLNVRIAEYYPMLLGNNDTRIPLDIDTSIYPSLIDTYNRNINYVKQGYVKLSNQLVTNNLEFRQYEAALYKMTDYISKCYPNIKFVLDDTKKMYKVWVETTSKYSISGIMNIGNTTVDIYTSDLKDIWIPELNIDAVLTKYQFMSSIYRFIPEFTRGILVSDALYNYYKNFIVDKSLKRSKFNLMYDTNTIVNFVSNMLPNIKKTDLVRLIESPMDINGELSQYYDAMINNGIDYGVAKVLLLYHKLVYEDTYNKVRASFNINGITNSGFSVTLPMSMYLESESQVAASDVQSII